MNEEISRRSFLAGMGACLAGSLSASCTRSESGDLNSGPLKPEPAGSQSSRTGVPNHSPGLSSSPMPMRILGNTGLAVSILAFGGGSNFMLLPEGDWQLALENAVKGGISLFDTAPSYGEDQASEKRFGKILGEKYRDRVILATKVESRDPVKARAEIEQSFQNLSTNVIDILQIHALEANENLDDIISDNGVWGLMKRYKEEGRVRFIGASLMYSPETAESFAEKAKPDVLLLAMNAFTGGRTPYADFENGALQKIRGQNVGVMSMKALRDLVGTSDGYMSAEDLLTYNLNLDLSTVIVGHQRLADLDANLEFAYSQNQPTSISPEEISFIRKRLQKRKSLPCWMQPGYVDGQPVA